jgi:hypothetical protein
MPGCRQTLRLATRANRRQHADYAQAYKRESTSVRCQPSDLDDDAMSTECRSLPEHLPKSTAGGEIATHAVHADPWRS